MVRILKKLLFLSLLLPAAHCIQAESIITISTSYNNLLSNRQDSGMLDLILSEAFSRIGYKAEFIYARTSNSLEDVNAGLADAEMNRIEGMEKKYRNLVMVTEPNMVMDFVAFSKDKISINGWDSIKGYYIGIVRGWKILEDNTRNFPHIVIVPTERELFRMLEKNRLDVALYSRLSGMSILKSNDYADIRPLSPPLEKRPMFLYFNSEYAELVQPLTGSLREMKADGTYESIVRGFEE